MSQEFFDMFISKAVESELEIRKLKADVDGLKRESADAYSRGHDTLENAIADVIGEEANNIAVEIVTVVRNVKRQRDQYLEELTETRDKLAALRETQTIVTDEELRLRLGKEVNKRRALEQQLAESEKAMEEWRLAYERMKRSHDERQNRVGDAVERLRETFTLRTNCDTIEDAVEDACAEMDQLIRDRETNAALDTEMQACDEITFLKVCEERDQLKADCEERRQAHGESEAKRIKLEESIEAVSMNRIEAQNVLENCANGYQGCHRCPALGCCDNFHRLDQLPVNAKINGEDGTTI